MPDGMVHTWDGFAQPQIMDHICPNRFKKRLVYYKFGEDWELWFKTGRSKCGLLYENCPFEFKARALSQSFVNLTSNSSEIKKNIYR